MKKLLWCLVVLGAPVCACAQADRDEDGEQGEPPRWNLGLGVLANDSPYAGEGARVIPIPLLNYRGERLQVGIDRVALTLIDGEAFELSAMGKLRFDGFDTKDLGVDELRANGIDSRLLEDRDMGFDVGLGMEWAGRAGEIEIELLADATDASGGQEASLQYGYPIALGGGLLTPNVSVTWQSEDMANYYYGTLDSEVARGVVGYKPGAITQPAIGLTYLRPLGGRWSLIGAAEYTHLASELKESPLTESDTNGSVSLFLGVLRAF
jgi:outer membrane protein